MEEPINIDVAPVILADYSIIRQSIDVRTENDEPAPRKSDIKVDLLNLAPARSGIGAEQNEKDQYSSAVSVTVNPSKGSNFYTCEIVVTGLFVVIDDSLSEDDVVRFISRRGTQELYDVARVALAQATTSGYYGMLMLPSIKVAPAIEEDGTA